MVASKIKISGIFVRVVIERVNKYTCTHNHISHTAVMLMFDDDMLIRYSYETPLCAATYNVRLPTVGWRHLQRAGKFASRRHQTDRCCAHLTFGCVGRAHEGNNPIIVRRRVKQCDVAWYVFNSRHATPSNALRAWRACVRTTHSLLVGWESALSTYVTWFYLSADLNRERWTTVGN